MADFVSNFLDGLKERRQREDLQAARAEQTRQFEANRASQMFEFNAQQAARKQALDLQRQQEQRLQKRQDFQDEIALFDMVAEGQADESVEGIDETMGGPVVESPTGRRVRLLTPEERATRKAQLDAGLAKTRISSMIETIGELSGPEGKVEAEKIFRNPKVLAKLIADVNIGNENNLNTINEAVTQLTLKKSMAPDTFSAGEQSALDSLTRLMKDTRPQIMGPGGLPTNPPTFEQQVDRIVEQTSSSIRPQVQTLTGLTPSQIVANPEIALQKLTEAVKAQEQSLSPSARPFIPIIVERIIRGIINDNKKPGKGGFLQGLQDAVGGGPESNLTPEQKKQLGFQ